MDCLIVTAQKQVIGMNLVRIVKTKSHCKSIICWKVDENTNHLLSECSKLAQKECKHMYDSESKWAHWNIKAA